MDLKYRTFLYFTIKKENIPYYAFYDYDFPEGLKNDNLFALNFTDRYAFKINAHYNKTKIIETIVNEPEGIKIELI